jgi:hypothetical protein
VDNFDEIIKMAFDWGKVNYPNSNIYRYEAFASSVAYLVTGASGGSGPSVRTHAVSWSLAGDGYNVPAQTSMGVLTLQFPDGRLPLAGEWEFNKACEFASPICFGELPKIAFRIYQEEHCFDDDPEDVKILRGN